MLTRKRQGGTAKAKKDGSLSSSLASLSPTQQLQSLSRNRGSAVVRFVLPGCQFCQESQPTWNRAMSVVGPGRNMLQFEHHMADVFRNLFNRDVQAFPTTLVIRNGSIASELNNPDHQSLVNAAASAVSKPRKRKGKKTRKGKK